MQQAWLHLGDFFDDVSTSAVQLALQKGANGANK